MIRCVIVDDEPLAVQLLEDYIRQTSSLQLCFVAYNAMEALTYLKTHQADLLFLDINMPRLSGMELASLLTPGPKIIFTTAYSEYAVQSYEKNAIDYLLKPITFDRFVKAVNRAEEVLRTKPLLKEAVDKDQSSVFIKSGKAMVNISFGRILFIEGLKDYVTFHTTDDKIIVYKRMKELEEILPAQFIRVHNSYVVNMQFISKVEDNHVYIGEQRIPVSEKYRPGFLGKIKAGLL